MIQLWSSNSDAYSHRCRIVVAAKDLSLDKGVGIAIKDIDLNNKPADLAQLNPYNQVPVLVDRNLNLYESNIINEYIDERFPCPQLMPIGVQEKGRARLFMFNFNRDLFAPLDLIIAERSKKQVETNRQLLSERLLELSGRLNRLKTLLNTSFSMVDITLAPLLWRLERLGIRLPPRGAPLLKYAESIFARDCFTSSLTPTERAMRK